MPLVQALRRQRLADICELEAILGYKVSSKSDSKTTERNPVSKNHKKFLISILTHFSFSSELFIFHEFIHFLLLIPSFSLCWSGRMQGVFLYLLRLACVQVCVQF